MIFSPQVEAYVYSTAIQVSPWRIKEPIRSAISVSSFQAARHLEPFCLAANCTPMIFSAGAVRGRLTDLEKNA
jgi:hypothetical protein